MHLKIKHNRFAYLLLLLMLCIFCGSILTISIDNDIIGEPDIECLDQEIRVWVKTRKLFAGRIYAKGKSEDPECSKEDFAAKRTNKPHFDLPLGMCGMKSLRSFDPRGMYYGITLVISFHPIFITKVDQVFHVKCFFEEASRGLTAELGVSMIPTTEIEARHGIPGCTYSIHRSSILDLDAGRPAGTPIQSAKVGDKVLHQWHCDDQMYGVLINNCYVTDGVNKKAQVIDTKGCPVDPILITGIRYSSDLQRAYAESQVFKFADRPGVWFFCQIQMCMKKDGMCDGITPPSCATTSQSTLTDQHIITLSSDNKEQNVKIDENNRNNLQKNLKTNNEFDELNIQTKAINRRGNNPNLKENNFLKIRSEKQKIISDYDNNENSKNLINHINSRDEKTKLLNNPLSHKQEYLKTLDEYGLPSLIEYEMNKDEPTKSAAVIESAYLPKEINSTLKTVSKYSNNSELEENNLNFNNKTNLKKNQQKEKNILKQKITTDFETIDDLAVEQNKNDFLHEKNLKSINSNNKFKNLKIVNSDYSADEDTNQDITIPSNLVDLLANLPADQINADNLQKMFRDSVADRRALLTDFNEIINKIKTDNTINKNENDNQSSFSSSFPSNSFVLNTDRLSTAKMIPGTKIDSINVIMDSKKNQEKRAKDSPLPITIKKLTKLQSNNINVEKQSLPPAFTINGSNDLPMISGQLLIYDLDETSPDDISTSHLNKIKKNDDENFDCVLSRQSIFLLGSSLTSLIITLIVVIIGLFYRIKKNSLLSYQNKNVKHQKKQYENVETASEKDFVIKKPNSISSYSFDLLSGSSIKDSLSFYSPFTASNFLSSSTTCSSLATTQNKS